MQLVNVRQKFVTQMALLLIGVMFVTGCPDSKVEVQRVGHDMPGKKMKGVFYALPRTLVLVRIPVIRSDKVPGKYQRFARCFFPDEADRRVKSGSTEFEIGDEIAFEAKGEPDPGQIFMVNTKAGWFQTKSLTMAYTEDGVLSSAKAETKDESVDFAISAFKTLASLGGAIATQGTGSSLFKSDRLGVLPFKRNLEPAEKAEALKARTLARKCYNYYVAATTAKTRGAADLLVQTLAAIEKAGGAKIEYKDDDLKLAEMKSNESTIENARAAELAADAIANPPAGQSGEGPGNTPDDFLNPTPTPSDSNIPPNKPRHRKGKNKRRSAKGAEAQEASSSEPTEDLTDPLKEGLQHERNAAELAAEVVGQPDKDGLAAQAKKHVANVQKTAADILARLPVSSEKELAEILLKSTGKALEGATAAINEALELSSGSNGVEFGDNFKSGYFEAAPFADRIFSLQSQREQILIGNPGEMKKDTLELMLKELDSTIKTYKQLYFLGAKKSDTWSATYQYLPPDSVNPKAKNDAIEEPVSLFDFSEEGGVCGGGLLASQGIKINPDFQIKTKCSEYKTVFLSVEKLKDTKGSGSQFAGVVQSTEFPDGYGLLAGEKRGFYYRIPSRTRFRVSVGSDSIPDNEMKRTILPVAQLGVIASLPISTGGRRTSYNITLDAATGALRNFELGSDAAIQKSMLDEAQSGVQSIIDAKDPLARLKRRKEFLETLKGVKDAEKALDNDNANSNSNANNNSNP